MFCAVKHVSINCLGTAASIIGYRDSVISFVMSIPTCFTRAALFTTKDFFMVKCQGKWLDPRYDVIDWNVVDHNQLVEPHEDNLIDENEEAFQQQPQQQQQQQQQQQAKPESPLPSPAEPPKSSAPVLPAMPVSPEAHGALVAARELYAFQQVELRYHQTRTEIEQK